MGLAFHQTDCPRYKVVCIRYIKRDEDRLQIQIYSSETGKWKISEQFFSAPYHTDFREGVYLHHAIHWVPSNGNPCYFKLDTEELKFLPSVVGVNGPIYFGESRGHLHLVSRKWADRGERHLQLNVYEMLNDYSGWFLKYRVELDELLNAYPQMIQTIKVIGRDQDPSIPQLYNYSVLDVVRGEEDDETFMAIFIPGKIIKYSVYDKSFK